MESSMNIEIRPEKPEDYPAIKRVNDLAFEQPNEGLLVEELRRNPHFIPELSLVALYKNEVVGHILFLPVRIICEDSPAISLALAPMAVLPEHQGKGIGGRLIEEGIAVAKTMEYESIIVVGRPGYYPRFGFQPASKWGLMTPYDWVPDEAFMAIELIQNSLEGKAGMVEFPLEYDNAM
jgi:putative acetyltransferase